MAYQESIYRHEKRLEWGYCSVASAQDDRTTFKFDDGASRTIMREHLHLMTRVDLSESEAIEAHKRIAKHSPSKSGSPAKAKKAKKAAAAAATKAAEGPIET